MKARTACLAIAIGAVALAACSPTGPPRTSERAVVESIVVTPSVVTAGGQFTATVTAVDDNEIIEIAPQWAAGPTGADLDFRSLCTVDPFTPDANRRVVVDVVCDVPAIASNGAWSLQVDLIDAGGSIPYGFGYGDFTVTGGSSDYSPPAVTYAVVPSNPAVGETFHVVASIDDDTGPITSGFGYTQGGTQLYNAPAPPIPCVSDRTQTSPTTWEWDFTCTPTGGGQAGTFGGNVAFADGLNQTIWHPFSVTIG